MVSLTLQQTIDVLTSLKTDYKCCNRCSLRFVGECHSHYFQHPEEHQQLKKVLPDITDTEDTQICTVCLGLLQKTLLNEQLTDKIVEDARTSCHEFKNFRCNLTLPVCQMLREKAVLLLLKEKFSAQYADVTDADVTPVKDVWKWMTSPTLAQLLDRPLGLKSPFLIEVHWAAPQGSREECDFLPKACPQSFKKQLSRNVERLSRVSVGDAMENMDLEILRRFGTCPLKVPCEPLALERVSFMHAPIYLAGRYNKYDRKLSQTPWVLDGRRIAEDSVQELLVTRLHDVVGSQEYTFSASGREDVDVMMLGEGRPFSVEFINPKVVTFSDELLQKMQDDVNSATKKVALRYLSVIDKSDLTELKQGEEEKRKHYRASCYCSADLTQQRLDGLADHQEIVLQQKTPIRVLHRRSVAIRERTVHTLRATLGEDSRHFELYLSTQAGTYVKEFVHGDFSRTRPSVGELLHADCDILELDVQDVDLVWPPKRGKLTEPSPAAECGYAKTGAGELDAVEVSEAPADPVDVAPVTC